MKDFTLHSKKPIRYRRAPSYYVYIFFYRQVSTSFHCTLGNYLYCSVGKKLKFYINPRHKPKPHIVLKEKKKSCLTFDEEKFRQVQSHKYWCLSPVSSKRFEGRHALPTFFMSAQPTWGQSNVSLVSKRLWLLLELAYLLACGTAERSHIGIFFFFPKHKVLQM